MSSNFIYYVYAYIRKTDGTPYYIGKGKGTRAWGRHRKNIPIPKNKSRIILLETNLSEIGALALERRLISWWGRKNLGTGILINLTNGGDGVSGLQFSDETKKILSLKNKGRKRIFTETHCQNLSKSKIGIKMNERAVQLNKQNREIFKYTLQSPNGITYITTNLKDFSKEHNLERARLRRKFETLDKSPIENQYKTKYSHAGWICLNKELKKPF